MRMANLAGKLVHLPYKFVKQCSGYSKNMVCGGPNVLVPARQLTPSRPMQIV